MEAIVFERHDLSKEMFRGLEFENWFYIIVQVIPLTSGGQMSVVRLIANSVFFGRGGRGDVETCLRL